MYPSNYVTLIEENDNEGETWKFFIPCIDNKESIQLLKKLVEDDEDYTLDITEIHESEVDVLVKHTPSGYMDHFNKLEGRLVIPDNFDIEHLYKGGIEGFMKK